MRVIAIIQARMGSTRLPGKVMMPLGEAGAPVLHWVYSACSQAPGVDDVWIATSTEPADDAIEAWCHANDIKAFRGSETDVLSRFYECMSLNYLKPTDVILRLTGDCPFLDSEVIGQVVRLMRNNRKLHFASNVSPRTYPDGLDVQAMTRIALSAAYHEATRPIDRDGVCTWIERNRSRFAAETLINPIPGMQDERWVLDTAEDYEFCQAVAKALNRAGPRHTMLDIASVLDRQPEIRAINAKGVMNERYFAAAAEEPVFIRSNFQRSQDALAKAEDVIPLGAQTFSKSRLQYAQPSPLFLSHGDGALVWDVDGNEYVDLVSALLPNVLGYRDPDVDVAIRRQLSSGISFSLAVELEAQLAETLRRLVPCAEMVRFGKTGTDATTAAIRLARAHTGRDRVLICGGYHGWADWSVERNRGVPDDVKALTTRVKWGDIPCPDLEQYAAVIVEPESREHLAWLRDACDKTGTILIFDEVITGFRFDLGGAQKLYGVTPDLACFGKAMANGMPLSAIVGRRDIMKLMAPPDNIFYSGTFFGETLSLAAGIATIAKLERDSVIEKIRFWGRELAHGAQTRIDDHGLGEHIKLSGHDSFKRLSFGSNDIAALFRREMVNSGTLITASHNVSFSHRGNEVTRILKSYDHALDVVWDAIFKGDIKERLAGAAVSQGVRA